jgi:hypothetical protein
MRRRKLCYLQLVLSDWREKQCEGGKGAARSGADCLVMSSTGGEYHKVNATPTIQNNNNTDTVKIPLNIVLIMETY